MTSWLNQNRVLSFLFSFCVLVLLLILFTGYTRTVLQFFTTVKSENGWRTLPGTEVAALLKKKLRNDINLLAYPVLEVDTFICQNNCSGITVNIKTKNMRFSYVFFFCNLGHGVCDQVTRRCNCQTFWMENPISVSNGADYNCGNVS